VTLSDPVITQLLEPVDAVVARVTEIRHVDPAPVLDCLESARTAVTAAEGALIARVPGREAMGPWLHELRGALNGMVGWAAIFLAKPDVATRDRAAEKMRACAAAVARLLASPPR
jgi:hypothetical protein